MAVDVEPETAEVRVKPLFGCDHGEEVVVLHPVEMVGLAGDRFEADAGFVDELVPVEVFDGAEVLLAELEELLVEVAFHLADAT